jgi:NADH-quinone oxidoreductase subunit G
VLAHFQRPAILFDDVVQRGRRGEWETAFVVGGYPEAWVSAELDQALGGATTLIVQDFFESPLTERAAIVIPSASFAEREGSFVNHAGLAQEIRAAIRPPDSVWPSGRVFFELAGRTGVFNARLIRKEMAAKISAFAALEQNDVRPNGVFLDARSARTTAPSGQLEPLAAVRGGAKP